jgi:hypothetical protein
MSLRLFQTRSRQGTENWIHFEANVILQGLFVAVLRFAVYRRRGKGRNGTPAEILRKESST